jgi:replicative DNA helicase
MPEASSSGPEKLRKSKGGKAGAEGISKPGYSQKTGSYLPDIHRTLPHSLDAEKGVLGSILLSPREALGECIERIDEKHFHVPAHSTIYGVLVDMWKANKEPDLVTLTQVLKDRGLLDQVGGPGAVTDLFTFVPTAANLAYYLEIVREKFILRQIISACTECAARSYDEQDQVESLLDDVERKIFAITEARFKRQMPSIGEHVMEAMEAIDHLSQRKGALTGLPTGFSDLDKMTDGLHGGEMFVIAARPSMGKTAFAMNIAEHVAVNMKKPVAIFSLEMSSQQLVQRLLCSRAGVNMLRVRDGFLGERDFNALTNAASKLGNSALFIDDSASISILELRAKARRLKAQRDIQLIVIDYLQLLRSTSKRAQDNRQIEISEISAGIKALAKELSIPIVVLAQLNRNPENRTGESKGRPRLSDLRESGSIEQDADVVTLLVREEYYADSEEEKAEAEGKAELIIAKQRNGPVGEVPLTFIKEFTRFEVRASVEEPA